MPSAGSRPGSGGDAPAPVRFVDLAASAGLTLVNVSGSAEKDTILESTGSGACFLDHDLDDDLDLYVVNGATLATWGPDNPAENALFENLGDGRFVDVARQAGVADNGWGGGCAVGDYDNDGDPDLYVTNAGPNVLYRNNGDGTFGDVTAAAGVGDRRWSAGASFVDVDSDGHLDLYVANYLAFGLEQIGARPAGCLWKGIAVMCGPRGFPGEPDVLYRNTGRGSFVDVSAGSGIGGRGLYGLGVVAGDVDGDRDADLVVANDSQPNLLFLNQGGGRFAEAGLESGLALSGDGRQQAGMGLDLGDLDGDGDQDLVVTNFSDDYHALYRNDGDALFTDVSLEAGLDPSTRPFLGWASLFFDYDNDGDLDLFFANGHVYPQVDGNDPLTSYRQTNLLFRNDGSGRFTDVTAESGPGLALVQPSRGAALGDYDDDGDLDLAVINDNEAPALLRNEGGNERPWLKVRLVGRESNRDGIGARLRLTAAGLTQTREVRLTAGYYSSHDPRVHFGLGEATSADRLEVRWPSGREQVFEGLPAGQLVEIDELEGLVGVRPLVPMAAAAPPAARAAPAAAAGPRPASPLPVPAGGPLDPGELRAIDALVQHGTRSLLSGRYAAGIDAYREALPRLPAWEAARHAPDALGFGDPEGYARYLSGLYDNLGVGLMRAERLAECAAAIERALSILPARAQYHHNLGLCHLHAGRYPEALAALERAREADPDRPGVDYDVGRVLAKAGRCEEAIAPLERAVGELPRPDPRGREAEAWYHLGSCEAARGRPAEAVAALREVLASVPGHQEALYKMGLALRRLGETGRAAAVAVLFAARQPAEETARAAQRAGARSPQEKLALAGAYLDAGLPPPALREAEAALAADPSDPEARVLHARAALAFRPPLLDLARRSYEAALAADPARLDALAGSGEVQRLLGAAARAESLLRRVLTRRADDPAATISLARLELARGREPAARLRLERLLAAAPAQPEALRALAEAEAGRDPARALALLDRAGSLYGEGIETRVRALAALGRPAEAEALLAESPFLGRRERAALARRLSTAGTPR